jgi:hypothetical protein
MLFYCQGNFDFKNTICVARFFGQRLRDLTVVAYGFSHRAF